MARFTALYSLCVLLSLTHFTAAKIPLEPLIGEQQSKLEDSDFVFNLAGSMPTIDSSGGRQFVMSRESSRGLRVPNGGGQVRANLLREEGGDRSQQAVVNDVTAGFSGYFPQAGVHFLQNNGCDEAVTLSVFNTSDEGLIDVASVLRLPRDTITQTFGNSKLTPIEALIQDVLIQNKACLRRCRLLKGRVHK
eukprot:IDg22670t1